jgi:hypothetical protein
MCGLCFALFLLLAGWHYEALRGLGFVLSGGAASRRGPLLFVLLGIFAAHALEVLVYAAAYYLLARQAGTGTLGGAVAPSLNASLYFSLETYSSLGYGDIVPTGALRLLAGAEALNGLLLLGWSACYLHAVLGPFPRGYGADVNTTTRPAERRCSRHRAR